MRSAIRSGFLGLVTIALTVASAQAQEDRWSGDGGLPPFYSWTEAVLPAPGRMLRTEPAPASVSVPAAAWAERILYSSTDWRDPKRRITVSGIIFFPKGKAPKGGWPVIAWAHGTTGIADVCAPSFLPRSPRDRDYFGHWLDAGYAIVATDYQGLGSPGVHPYLHYTAEGIGVLDSIRAALRHYRELSRDKIVTMGQSQGSEGAIAAAWLVPHYAPKLRLKGVVATGIVAETRNIGAAPQVPVPALYLNDEDYGNSAYEALSFLGTLRAIDPAAVRPEDYISAEAMAMLDKARMTCMSGLRGYAAEIRLRESQFYKVSSDRLNEWAEASTLFPDVKIAIPVFVGTGLADSDAQTSKQYNFISAMCAAGTPVEWHYYPHATHGAAVGRSLADSPAFVAKVMSGGHAGGNCAELVPPGPLQSPD